VIVHLVLMRFPDPADAEEAERLARDLLGRIPVVRRLTAGRNVRTTANSYDLGLVVELDSLEDLAAYHQHPAHEQAAAFFRRRRSAVASLDLSA
jgi:hypothetical protein